MKITIIIIAALIIIGGGAFAFTRSKDKKVTNTTSNTAPTTSTNNSPAASTPAASGNTITYTNNGFSPASLTVKANSQVTIKNTSSQSLQFDSDPHPQHTDDLELNVGILGPGESQTITVTKTGSHGYHNHLNPDDTGTLIVD
ncbi:MAG TPA: cupredoxin domain-containing protein [Candidatus Saccharimonadales bacterium]|nr:cupredoxin domain-containing protein [Candidatus Saccharimonadales bacterium]